MLYECAGIAQNKIIYTIFAAFKFQLFEISMEQGYNPGMELGILEKSNREGICAEDSESMRENA